MMPRYVTFTLLLVGWTVNIVAQESPPAIPHDIIQAQERIATGQYLAALSLTEKSKAPKEIVAQQLATIRSFVGDGDGAVVAMNSLTGDRSISIDLIPEDCMPLDAIDAIVERAMDRQVVILNEAHHVPLHRAFCLTLATRLRQLGFEYFAAETFSPAIVGQKEFAFPVRETGYYSQEPVFGDLIRQVAKLGYKPIAYECETRSSAPDFETQIQHRETAQTQNLIDRIFRNNQNAKVLIYVGYDHATENFSAMQNGGELGWMAAQLGRRLNIDPLTIDQSTPFRWNTAPASSIQSKIARREMTGRSICLQSAQGSMIVRGKYANRVDMQVLHPATDYRDGRPVWLVGLGGRKSIPIPLELEYPERVLVQAFLANESDRAVPLDQVLLMPGQPRPSLMLRNGHYRIVVQNESGNEVARTPLSVE